MAGGDNSIEVEGLVREFKKGPRAVDGIDLRVDPGEIYGFLGPNGGNCKSSRTPRAALRRAGASPSLQRITSLTPRPESPLTPRLRRRCL